MAGEAAAQSVITLDPVTVLATKTEEKAIDSLSAVSTLRQPEITQIGPKRIEDLLVTMPGVWFQERADSPETAINIRGLQDFGRVAVIVDGARQNFQHSGHNANGSFLLDPELLSGVDIVRGPVANIYGSGAIGGVASFTTKDVDDILRPGERWGGQVHGLIGSNPGYPVTSAFGAWRINPNLEAIVGGSYRTSDDYKDGHGDVVPNSGYDLGSGLAKVTVRPADGHQLKLTGITESSNYETGQFNVPPPAQPESVYATDLKTDIVSARWTYARPEDRLFDFDGNIYWTRTRQDQIKIEGSTNPITGAVGDARSFSVNTTGFDLHNTSRFDTGALRHAVTYGGDFFRDDVENFDPNGNGAVLTPNGKRTVSGAFAQWKINYSTWLQFITALRYDSYHLEGGGTTADGDHLSPKATLGITPVPGITVYGTYAEGYRAPAVTETLVTGAHPPFATGFPELFTLLPNPTLQPEIGKTKELGLNLKFDNLLAAGDHFRGKINVFRNDIDDYIELINFGPPINFTFCPAPFPGCPPVPAVTIPINNFSLAQYQNITHGRIQGIELEGRYDAGRWFVDFAGQHMTGEDVDADIPLATIPPDKVSLGFGMRFLDNKLTAMVRWIGVAAKKAGDIPDRDSGGTPDFSPTAGYGYVNLFFAYEPTPDTQITFAIDNVFDRYYVPYMAESSNRAFAGPGISFKGGIKIRFGDQFYRKG
jgi:hemoglobin/transferrin/lactoferrin receptor protein